MAQAALAVLDQGSRGSPVDVIHRVRDLPRLAFVVEASHAFRDDTKALRDRRLQGFSAK